LTFTLSSLPLVAPASFDGSARYVHVPEKASDLDLEGRLGRAHRIPATVAVRVKVIDASRY
jgi:hypothetical protein